MSRPSHDRPPKRYVRTRLLLAVGLILLIGTGTAWWLAFSEPVLGFDLSATMVRDEILSWGMWGVAGSILIMVLHSFVPFPAEIVAMANGMAYGPFWGTVVTWSGAMLGAILAFALSRWLGRPFVEAMISERHRTKIDDWIEDQGAGTLFFSRFVPVISFNLINYLAGLTVIRWWTFIWVTGLGILPLTFLMVWMGDRMGSDEAEVWLWLLAIGIVGWIVWHWFHRRRTHAKSP